MVRFQPGLGRVKFTMKHQKFRYWPKMEAPAPAYYTLYCEIQPATDKWRCIPGNTSKERKQIPYRYWVVAHMTAKPELKCQSWYSTMFLSPKIIIQVCLRVCVCARVCGSENQWTNYSFSDRDGEGFTSLFHGSFIFLHLNPAVSFEPLSVN